jgi:DNA-binding PadR family transcriptional regulator
LDRVTLSTNEHRILGVLAEKDALEPADCARLADLGVGMTDAALRSLVTKGLAAPNVVRKGLSKKPDGTYSITADGRAERTA